MKALALALGGAGLGLIANATLSPSPPVPLGASPSDKAVRRAVPLLQKSAKLWTERAQCTSCHHQSLGSVAIAAIGTSGYPVDRSMATDQLKAVREYRDQYVPRMFYGRGSINPPITDAFALWASGASNERRSKYIDASLVLLRLRQGGDGGWTQVSYRPPMEHSRETVTALSIFALKSYGSDLDQPAIHRARKWLEKVEPVDAEARTFRLLGLIWAGAPRDSIQKAVQDVLKAQKTDGGWEQIPEWNSEAYSTGQALVALQLSGLPKAHPAIRRGAEFLVRTQLPDGTWRIKTRRVWPGLPYFETGFPHGIDQFISYAGTAWAAMALAEYSTSRARLVLMPRAQEKGKGRAFDLAADPKVNGLLNAIVSGSLSDVRAALAPKPNLAAKSREGRVPLHYAAFDHRKARLLLDAGASLASTDSKGDTPLDFAVMNGGIEEVKLMVERGANINPTSGSVGTPLARAVEGHKNDVARYLLAKGALVNPSHEVEMEPLRAAVWVTNHEMLRTLLSMGALPDDLLPDAIIQADETVFDLLLKYGALPNVRAEEGNTALHVAAAMHTGHDRFIRKLLKAGASPSLRNESGMTPLQWAKKWGNKRSVAALESC